MFLETLSDYQMQSDDKRDVTDTNDLYSANDRRIIEKRLIMNIQVNTDHNIDGSEELHNYVKNNLTEAFDRFNGAITRIEVHLSDENAGKVASADKRCLLEARVAHHQPIVVSHHADNIHQAIEHASDKLLRALDTMVGKLTDRTSPKDLLPKEKVEVEEED